MAATVYPVKDIWLKYTKSKHTGLFETKFCALNSEQSEAVLLTTNETIKIGVKPYPQEKGTLQSSKPKYKERYFLTPLLNATHQLVSEIALADDGKLKDFIENRGALTVTEMANMEKVLNKEFVKAEKQAEKEEGLTLTKTNK